MVHATARRRRFLPYLATSLIACCLSPTGRAQQGSEPQGLSPVPVVAPRDVFIFNNNQVLSVPPAGTGPGVTTSTVSVSGVPVGHRVLSVKVSLHVTHTFAGDLDISLIGPGGAPTIELTSDNGSNGNNYGTSCATASRTTFDDSAATLITAGAPPFVGSFRPEQPLSGFVGTTPGGTWTLQVGDDAAGDSGSLQCWSVTIETAVLPEMIGLVSTGDALIRFDSADPSTITSTTPLTGVVSGDLMRAIDFRPANHVLYGIASNNLGNEIRLYTIDPATGVATPVSPSPIVGLTAGFNWGMSFNPVADRIRVVNDFDENFRINPNSGFRTDTPTNDLDLTPASVIMDSVAYSNSFAGATSTTVFGLNLATKSLARIGGVNSNPSPNLGAVTDIGLLGVDFGNIGAALDMTHDGTLFTVLTTNVSFVTGLYGINVATGAATRLGTLGTGIPRLTSLAVVPPLTDVQITAADSPDPVVRGANLTYTIGVSSAGSDVGALVQATLPLPTNTTFVSFTTPAGWSISTPPVGGTGTITASKSMLASSEPATLTLVVNVNAGTPIGSSITLNATVDSPFESVPANNTATVESTVITTPTPTDFDGDTLPDAWEQQFGLSTSSGTPPSEGPLGDADKDGVSNADEHTAGTHPRGFVTRYFAEGATSDFFDTSIAILNTSATSSAKTLLRHLRADGTTVNQFVDIPVLTRATLNPESAFGPVATEFGTVIEADTLVVADRSMRWDPNGYGSHAERALDGPQTTWYLAEGATHSGFNLFYLIQNANSTAASVQVTYLLPAPNAPIVKSYLVAPSSRFNVWVNLEGPALASTDVSAIVTASQPVIVERAMYLNSGGLVFGAGHESAGVTAPASSWFLAEGATGDFFDLFVLIANPNPTDSAITATYLLPDGSTIVKNYVASANSRFNIWVDLEDPLLAATAVSTTIMSTNGVPVIVERAMWWPGSSATWFEAHNSAGSTLTGTRWGLADGEQSGPSAYETYILIANTSSTAGAADVTLYFEDSTSVMRTFPLNANSRFNVAVGIDFPEALGRRFGAVVQSTGSPAAQVVVERAVYSNAFGVVWAAGTNALATRLQ